MAQSFREHDLEHDPSRRHRSVKRDMIISGIAGLVFTVLYDIAGWNEHGLTFKVFIKSILEGGSVSLAVMLLAAMIELMASFARYREALVDQIQSIKTDMIQLSTFDENVKKMTDTQFGGTLNAVVGAVGRIELRRDEFFLERLKYDLERMREHIDRIDRGCLVVDSEDVIPFAIREFQSANDIFATSFLRSDDDFWRSARGEEYLRTNAVAIQRSKEQGALPEVSIVRVFILMEDSIGDADRETLKKHLDCGIGVWIARWGEAFSADFHESTVSDFALFRDKGRVSTWTLRHPTRRAEWYRQGTEEYARVLRHVEELASQVARGQCFVVSSLSGLDESLRKLGVSTRNAVSATKT